MTPGPELLNRPLRLKMFADLPRVLGMVISFPSYQVLFLTANSPFPENPFDLIDGFLYFWVDVSDILL
jgi:hypothetical protein